MMRAPVVGFVLLGIMGVALGQAPTPGEVEQSPYKVTLVADVEIPGTPIGIPGTRDRPMTVAQDFPGAGGESVIIVARKHAVEYRLGDGSLLLRREFADWEYPQVSKRGRYIGVMCKPFGRKEDAFFRVETWDGDVVWQAHELWGPDRYRAVSDLGGAASRAVRHSWGMQIRGPDGRVVYEGPPSDSLYSSTIPGDFSADGRYYTETFAYRSEASDIMPGVHQVRPGGVCLVFWDALSGRELWRRWFRGRYRGVVAVSATGDVVAVAPEDTMFSDPFRRKQSVFVFDRLGNELGRYEPACAREDVYRCGVTSLQVSDDGRFVGVGATGATQLVDLANPTADALVLLQGPGILNSSFAFGTGGTFFLTVNSVLYVYRGDQLIRVIDYPRPDSERSGSRVGIGIISPNRVAVGRTEIQIYDLEEVARR